MERNIGILTLPLHSNYGGLLQAYALQEVVSDFGYNVLNIDVKNQNDSYFWRFKFIAKQTLKYLMSFGKMKIPRRNWMTKEEKSYIRVNTDQFIKQKLRMTRSVGSHIKMERIKEYNFEAIIVGSDQVWRPQYTPFIGNYFLDFIKNQRIRRISYAASFGVDEWQFSRMDTEKCSKEAKKFHSISVREDTAIALCKEKLDVDATLVLDPTLLLRKEDYLALMPKSLGKSQGTEGIFTYILDDSEKNRSIVKKVENYLDTFSFKVMPGNKNHNEFEIENYENFVYPAVQDWIEGFHKASFIVTDSFHGTLFSIIFNKPFISIGNKKRGVSRFKSILALLDLEPRLVLDPDQVSIDLIKKPINYVLVNKLLKNQQEKSREFLRTSLMATSAT
ncbi:polysaccharide pyruvyl transferase family protein [Flavobacteriaceae bacterium D16]|nr:polysaccharide pyruvyl transferase family protein [Flavobacteriaceae bacterium D16]